MQAILTTNHKNKQYQIGYSNAHAAKNHANPKPNLDQTSYAWLEPQTQTQLPISPSPNHT
jgi:hypothetical protein